MPVATNRATNDVIQAADINQIATLTNTLETAVADLQAGGAEGLPFYIRPANTSTDIGPLINSALQTYGAAVVAPNPVANEYWSCTTPIQIGTNETLTGYGMGTSKIRCSSTFPTSSPLVGMRTGTSAGFTISDLQLHANSRATSPIYLYATAGPDSAALTTPDFAPTIERVHARGGTGDGIYVGGLGGTSGGYDGNLREARVRWCLCVGNSGWGLTVASSDMFVENVTCHGNGPGGIRSISGDAGNLKLLHCKPYYETVGMRLQAVRPTVKGGEIQDCGTAIEVPADSYIATTIDTCGTNSIAAIVVNGSGCSFATHMTSRNPPAGSPGTMLYAVELSSNTQIHGGFINTNFLTGKYTNIWRGTNRPASGSTLVVS